MALTQNSAAIAGTGERAVMNQTGRHSPAMVRRDIRDGSLFRENAAAKVGGNALQRSAAMAMSGASGFPRRFGVSASSNVVNGGDLHFSR
jgi:hypothetical protein